MSPPGHAHQRQQHQLVANSEVYLQTKNQLDPSNFFKESCNLIDQTFWANNSRTKILPDMRFVIESQELKDLSFYICF